MEPIDFEEYQSWMKQWFSEGYFDLESIQMSEELVRFNSLALLQLLRIHAEQKEYRNLASLTEALRSNGFFYFDYIEEFGIALEIMLRQAISVFDNGELFSDHSLLWLPCGIYDIIFHQIRLLEYPPICSKLYFELSNRILDSKFMPLYEFEKDSYAPYSQCLYFIEMADNWFADRGNEFLILWKKIDAQIRLGIGYPWLEDIWPATYMEFKKKT
ncbi:hypothetical protein SAMN05428988_3560 [Chitinophaga sp. YR573]|uniref:hypothetical protein n=1 Tax=Chitinophaga sp. YR573 TaxID=1881040 RepID=UPI0008C79774|nr:hypothetical protein [Chitinophaga sp. YR573]SEW24754.1 hypothetical protein SAMN05428988_3560 [Chitinophaga sp. YR573]